MRQSAGDPAFSQSLERGPAILTAFTPDRPALGISELARELALTRSTTHRYVATLTALGYLQQDDSTRKYRLGTRVLDLGFSVLGSMELREIAAPHLRRLTDTTGHTSNLAIRDDADVILIDRVRGRPGRYHHLEFALHVGSRIPAYCSATGKALLAFLPRRDLDGLLDRIDLVQRGPRTLTSRAALLAELARVRRTGIAVNDGGARKRPAVHRRARAITLRRYHGGRQHRDPVVPRTHGRTRQPARAGRPGGSAPDRGPRALIKPRKPS